MSSTININSIPDKSVVYVTGTVDYSRIASQISGEELAADNARKASKGMIGTDKPHTRLVINRCAIDYANPSAPTLAEQYIAERLYVSSVHPENGKYYTATNKSHNLPAIFCRTNAQTKEIKTISAEGELAAGTPVTIVLRFFATNRNAGVSLDSVIVNKTPVDWYKGRGPAATLEANGFTVVSDDTAPSADELISQLNKPIETPNPAPTATPTAMPYSQPVAQTAPAPQSTLPTPPTGYQYDETGRLVPIQGGIRL